MNTVSYLLFVLGLMNVNQQVYSRHARISGGMNATACRSCVALLNDDKLICGGALIGKKSVITSVDCCNSLNGEIKLEGLKLDSLKQTFGLNGNVTHPDYNEDNEAFNFCVIFLDKEVKMTSDVNILKIADNTPKKGDDVRLYGWGRIERNSEDSVNKLKRLDMKSLPAKDCQDKYDKADNNDKLTISMDSDTCATSAKGSGCLFDQGGPLIKGSGDTARLVGVLSSKSIISECKKASDKLPNVFGDTAKVKKWIQDQIKESEKE